MLNKAHQIMNQRNEMIEEAKQVLAILGATEEEMMYKAPMTNITINKGRIIEVPVTKEIIIDNTNEEEIKQLKDELFAKELLINDFREAMDKNIKEKHALEAEYSALQNSHGELDEAYEVLADNLADRNRRIEDLKEDILDLKDELEVKDGIISNLNAQLRAAEERIKELTKENNRARASVYTEVFSEPTEEKPVVKETKEEPKTKGGDAMASMINVPDKYMVNPEIVEQLNYWNNYIAGLTEDKIMFGKVITAESLRKQALTKANEVLAKLMKDADNSDAYKLTYDVTRTKSNNSITSVYGKITLDNKEYAFKYDATFEKPVVYGCMSMNQIDEAKAVIDALGLLDRDESALGQKHKNPVHYDFDNNIVVWVTDDGCFKGYTREYAFVWDPKHAVPCGAAVKNALNNFRKYKKMNASWGPGFPSRAAFIMNYCREMQGQVSPAKETNEVVVNVTKEPKQQTEEVISTMWDDFDC